MWPPGHARAAKTPSKRTDSHVAPLLAMTEVKTVETLSPTTTPPAPAKRSGAEREATGITNFTSMVDGVSIPCPVRSEAPARKPVPRKSPCPGAGQSPPPTVLPKAPKVITPSHPGVEFQREGAYGPPPFGRFKGVVRGEIDIPPDNFSWGARGGILSIRKEYPSQASDLHRNPRPRPTGGTTPAPQRGPPAAGHHLLPIPAGTAGHPDPSGGQKPPGFPGTPAQRAGPESLSLSPEQRPPQQP